MLRFKYKSLDFVMLIHKLFNTIKIKNIFYKIYLMQLINVIHILDKSH